MRVFTTLPGVRAHFVSRSTLGLLAVAAIASSSQAQVPFTEEGPQRGVDWPSDASGGAGQGMAFADLDGDGDPDWVLVDLITNDGQVGVFENDGTGNFTDHGATAGIGLLPGATGVFPADYDADGDLDLFIGQWGFANALYRNDGNFQFVDVTAAAGLGDVGRATGCAWTDYNGDGWLDLYVSNLTLANTTLKNRFWHNNGDGTFTDVAPNLGLDFGNLTWKASFTDIDLDGDQDLYMSNDKCGLGGVPGNYMYRNDGGVFTDITAQSGTGVCIDSMGTAVGDFTNNGYPDFYPTNTPSGHPLLLARGDGSYLQLAAAAGVECFQIGWGASYFDFDLDGDQDLYVCQQSAPNRFFQNSPNWPLTDIAGTMGVQLPSVFSFTMAHADIDNDGDLDFAVQSSTTRIQLYINQNQGAGNWAKFRVAGEGKNTFGVGTRIKVRTGLEWRTREVKAGENFKSQNTFTRHFGLGDATVMDHVVAYWPGGTVRHFSNAPVNHTWTLIPPTQLGDADRNGVIDVADFSYLTDCFDANGGIPFAEGMECMDYDGDFDVDRNDLAPFFGDFNAPHLDCNGNGISDFADILYGSSTDNDENGIPDEC
jgi:ASPIC and UnbV/FG-GAP-like repeat